MERAMNTDASDYSRYIAMLQHDLSIVLVTIRDICDIRKNNSSKHELASALQDIEIIAAEGAHWLNLARFASPLASPDELPLRSHPIRAIGDTIREAIDRHDQSHREDPKIDFREELHSARYSLVDLHALRELIAMLIRHARALCANGTPVLVTLTATPDGNAEVQVAHSCDPRIDSFEEWMTALIDRPLGVAYDFNTVATNIARLLRARLTGEFVGNTAKVTVALGPSPARSDT
jgi:hypothetical protein